MMSEGKQEGAIRLATPAPSKKFKNIHLERNIEMFSKIGVTNTYIDNKDLVFGDLERFDAVYLNWFENIDGGKRYKPLLRYLAKQIQLCRVRRSCMKVIFVKHNRFPHNPAYPALSKRLYLKLCEMADVIVAFNADAREDLQSLFPGSCFDRKITVIPPINYIGAYKDNPESDVYSFATQFCNKLVFTFLGKILPYKNIDFVLRAAEAFEGKNAAFFIAGEPASTLQKREIEEFSTRHNNTFVLLERIDDADMQPVLDVSDVLVMPYDTASASNSGTGRLAFSYGVTVVSPVISSMKAIPEDLFFGYSYDSSSEHYMKFMGQLEAAYDEWELQPEALKEKGEKLRRLMADSYSENVIIEKYKDLFRELFGCSAK